MRVQLALGISNIPENRISRYMGAAERYLSEMNYEPAVIEFQKILEIDPMNVDAYLGLAEAYIAMDDKNKAQEVLNNGYNNTRSDDIKGCLDELEKFDALELGEAYLSESKFKDAITEYKKALSFDNKCIEAYIGIADERQQKLLR